MEQLHLKVKDGKYSAPIDITVDELKEMLQDSTIFNDASLNMVKDWYAQPHHQASSKEIMRLKQYSKKGTPYNGIVVGLGKRIIKHLNRFDILDTNQEGKSYFIIVFEGWYENCNGGSNFIWKVRDELATALEDLGICDKMTSSDWHEESDDNTSVYVEGSKKWYYTTKYERDYRSRKEAIKIHGTYCQICGFDFEKVYGSYGKGYIEVHHLKPLSDINGEAEVNPDTDLICVCANCHRMLHRMKGGVLEPEQLKEWLTKSKSKKQPSPDSNQ